MGLEFGLPYDIASVLENSMGHTLTVVSLVGGELCPCFTFLMHFLNISQLHKQIALKVHFKLRLLFALRLHFTLKVHFDKPVRRTS